MAGQQKDENCLENFPRKSLNILQKKDKWLNRLEEEIRDVYAQTDNLKDKSPRLHKISLSGQSEKIESFVPADIAAF